MPSSFRNAGKCPAQYPQEKVDEARGIGESWTEIMFRLRLRCRKGAEKDLIAKQRESLSSVPWTRVVEGKSSNGRAQASPIAALISGVQVRKVPATRVDSREASTPSRAE